jgi:hypothetical protein
VSRTAEERSSRLHAPFPCVVRGPVPFSIWHHNLVSRVILKKKGMQNRKIKMNIYITIGNIYPSVTSKSAIVVILQNFTHKRRTITENVR